MQLQDTLSSLLIIYWVYNMDKEDQKQTEAKTDDKAIQDLCWDLAPNFVVAKESVSTRSSEENERHAASRRAASWRRGTERVENQSSLFPVGHCHHCTFTQSWLCLSMLVLFLTASKSIYYYV